MLRLKRKEDKEDKEDKEHKELESFLNFLHKISQKKEGEDIDTQYKNIKLYFIGRNEVLKSYGVAPYYRWIQEDCKNGVTTLYLLAMQNYHITAADVLSKLLSEHGIAHIDDRYVGEIKKGVRTAIIRMVASQGGRSYPSTS